MTVKDLQDQFTKYVTLDRFTPIEKIVYGAVGIGLTAIVVKLLVSINLK